MKSKHQKILEAIKAIRKNLEFMDKDDFEETNNWAELLIENDLEVVMDQNSVMYRVCLYSEKCGSCRRNDLVQIWEFKDLHRNLFAKLKFNSTLAVDVSSKLEHVEKTLDEIKSNSDIYRPLCSSWVAYYEFIGMLHDMIDMGNKHKDGYFVVKNN